MQGALAQYENPAPGAFRDYFPVHNALPELNLGDVNPGCTFLGRDIAFPFMIASLTGGPEQGGAINRNLAVAAQQQRVPLALGSMKIVFREPETMKSFDVRALCPDVPLMLNLGLADLGSAFSVQDCARVVKQLAADALIFHINPLHEALQACGTTNFKGLTDALTHAVQELECPVIVKEVGHGISADIFRRLDHCGVHAVDVAGQGGTSWGFIEGYRAQDAQRKEVCRSFEQWGIPTHVILEDLRGMGRNAALIASGGITTGVDVFMALCLGADLAAAAGPLLEPALESAEQVEAVIERFSLEFKTAMFATGCARVADINETKIRKRT